ncbi:MAG: [Fe-Fe] hydrogenase large subunit C-terminal domain-containing protein [Candidatus Micrarchaeia archaeon]
MEEIYLGKTDLLIQKLEEELKGPKTVVVQIAPAVRVTLGEMFSRPYGEDNTGKVIGALQALGFTHVVDTSIGADAASYLEARELVKYLEKGDNSVFPKFNSCCIGWMLYVKRRHKELLQKSSICPVLSPQLATGALVKLYSSKKLGLTPDDIIVVSIMPCTMKKEEALERSREGRRHVDYVMTTVELAEWMKKRGIDFNSVKEGSLSPILPVPSRLGVGFGATGGVSESIMETAAHFLGERPVLADLRNDDQIYRKTYRIGKYEVKMAKVFGFRNLEAVLKEIEGGKFYHFVEVMQCEYGCVGGPGQPQASSEQIKLRAAGMRGASIKAKANDVLDTPSLKEIIDEVLGVQGECTLNFSWM